MNHIHLDKIKHAHLSQWIHWCIDNDNLGLFIEFRFKFIEVEPPLSLTVTFVSMEWYKEGNTTGGCGHRYVTVVVGLNYYHFVARVYQTKDGAMEGLIRAHSCQYVIEGADLLIQ